MGNWFDESLAIGILFTSIKVLELNEATAEIKMVADKGVNWEDVSERLIDEAKNLKHGSQNPSISSME